MLIVIVYDDQNQKKKTPAWKSAVGTEPLPRASKEPDFLGLVQHCSNGGCKLLPDDSSNQILTAILVSPS